MATTAPPTGWTWRDRLVVAQAGLALALARLLVRRLAFGHWSPSLGATVAAPGEQPRATAPGNASEHDRALLLARCVGRAAHRLPFETRCLPRAVATQWLLRLRGIPSRLAIAVDAVDRKGADAYHAWVEHDGRMIIGHCDRARYRPVMVIAQGQDAGQDAGRDDRR